MTNSSTPGEDRRASSLSGEFFVGFLRNLAGKFGAFFSSPRWARWGGVSLVIVGIMGIALMALSLLFSIHMPTSGLAPAGSWMETLAKVIGVLWLWLELFVFVGLVGIYSLVGDASQRVRRTLLVGLILLGVSTVSWIAYSVRNWIFGPSDPYYSPSGFFDSEAFFFLMEFGGPVGILLVGVAAMWARGLGIFRFLPLSIALLGSPLLSFVMFRIYSGGDSAIMEPTVWLDVIVATPIFLASLGWILVGIAMFGAKEREARIIGRERRETKERNLVLARRLYEKAWGNEELSVVDEIISEDFFDERRNREGAAAFKQAISDLHYAFPNMKADITEQTAEGDEVFTRITFSGTDEGGVLYYPPTNKTAAFTGTFTDRFDGDGKLIEHDGELDEESLIEQLGLPTEE